MSKSLLPDIPHSEYKYRKGFVAGYQVALALVGRGDQAGYPLTSIMGAANTHVNTLERWRDCAPPAEKPPKNTWTYGPLAAAEPPQSE